MSGETYRRIKDEAACSVAPEICIEILSSSSTEEEITEKRALYFEQGAQEFWLCDQNGRMTYFDPAGEAVRSALCPDFPQEAVLDQGVPSQPRTLLSESSRQRYGNANTATELPDVVFGYLPAPLGTATYCFPPAW